MDNETAKRFNKQFNDMVKDSGPFKKFQFSEDYVFDWKALHGKNLFISVGTDEGYSESITVTGTDFETGVTYVLHQEIKKS